MPRLLIVSDDGPAYREIFAREAPDLDVMVFDPNDPSAAAFAREMDILYAWYFPPELLRDAPRLRWISSTGAGVDNVMAAREYLPAGVPVTRMVHVFDDAMAEYVLGYLLAFQLNARRTFRQQAAKEWIPFNSPLLRGGTAAVVGLGSIGSEVARTLRRAGLDVIGVSRSGRAVDGLDEVHPLAGLDAVLPRADYLVLVVPLTPESRGSIDARRLALLPERAVLVNIGRGAVVRQDGLIAALQSGKLRGAVLDVFETEPLPEDSPFWTMDNVIVTPHISGPDDVPINAQRFLENYRRFQAGEPMVGQIDFQRGY
ncbi:MAG: D-2-hydroxyacid dehydrogenase [Chloroflexi bacterium]|nr:D-2-hydroxyacid dehydrogenase [Chloroflexota bacterium]